MMKNKVRGGTFFNNLGNFFLKKILNIKVKCFRNTSVNPEPGGPLLFCGPPNHLPNILPNCDVSVAL